MSSDSSSTNSYMLICRGFNKSNVQNLDREDDFFLADVAESM